MATTPTTSESAGLTPAQAGYGTLWMQAAAGLMSAFGGMSVARHQNSIAKAQANIARINAQSMELQAQAVLRANESATVRKTMEAGQLKSAQRAALAANGVAVGEGSAAEVQASTDIVKEMDKNQMKENAVRNAWGYRMQAANYEGQALMAEASKQSVGLNFATSLLNSAAQVGTNYLMMSANGMFDTKKEESLMGGSSTPAASTNKMAHPGNSVTIKNTPTLDLGNGMLVPIPLAKEPLNAVSKDAMQLMPAKGLPGGMDDWIRLGYARYF